MIERETEKEREEQCGQVTMEKKRVKVRRVENFFAELINVPA